MLPQHSDNRIPPELRNWDLRPPADPGFRPEVWAKIGARSPVHSWAGYIRAHVFTVTLTLLVATVAGSVVGAKRAESAMAADTLQHAASYVRALDPRKMRTP